MDSANSIPSIPTCSFPTSNCRSSKEPWRSWDPGKTWGVGDVTSIRVWPTRSNGSTTCSDGTILETPWRDLDPQWQHLLLWGTGNQHITFTWRGGASPVKYGGKYEGIIPELLSKHRNSKSRPQIRQLEKYMRTLPCAECRGERLVAQARSVCVTTAHAAFQDAPRKSLPAVCHLSVREAADFFEQLQLDATGQVIAAEVLKEIRHRLGFLVNVGLDYLTLDRTAPTLSGGESQRIRLASQIGSGLVGVLYILDEPSIGLHPRDNHRLLDTLHRLRDMGNTVVVVEHDEDTMRAADHLIDFGPGPGVRGGRSGGRGIAQRCGSGTGKCYGQVSVRRVADRDAAAASSAWRQAGCASSARPTTT